MGWTGIWQWVVVLVIVLILFGGRGKISALMGDFGKGLKAFKKSVKDGDENDKVDNGGDPKAIDMNAPAPAESTSEKDESVKK